MKVIQSSKGDIIMGDAWDYDLWRSQKAWELAMRIIPEKPAATGAWTGDNFLKKAQEELQMAYDIMGAVFKPSLRS